MRCRAAAIDAIMGMMEAAPNRRKLLVLPVIALALLSCLPKPKDETEFPESERSIIIQMKTVEHPDSEFEQRLAVPELTVYGDGTLIVAGAGGDLLQARLDDGEIRDLLDYLDGKGFFDFDYEQPRVDPPPPGAATYIFATTTLAQNAVRACALTSEPPQDAGEEWSQFRRLQAIRDRLLAIETAAAGDFESDGLVVLVERFADLVDPAYPLSAAELTEIAPEVGAVGTKRLTGEAADAALSAIGAGRIGQAVTVTDAPGRYRVAYRPLLPHEDNFPEFDLPRQSEGTSFGAPLAGCG